MLNRLSVNNYALIRNLEIEFTKPFSVITGETGAGKSIILGALSLILGNRADNLTFADNTRKCTIEGTFDISKCELNQFFEENSLDYDTTCIIRREVTPQGKSRAFINDTPVNLIQLKDLAGRLIDVHSQHQTLLLRENSFQLSVVDAVAGNGRYLKDYKVKFREYSALLSELKEITERNEKARTELDYFLFISDELMSAALTEGEQEILEEELEIQSHAEEIKGKLFNTLQLLSEDENNIISRLKDSVNLVNTASSHYSDLKLLVERLNSTLIELKDIAENIEEISEKITFSPERMDQINDRLTLIYKLQQKHHVKSIAELKHLAENLNEKIRNIESLDSQVENLTLQKKTCFSQLNNLADELSERRKSVSQKIETSIVEIVRQLGIKDASFCIDWKSLNEPGREGKDEVRFLFSANKGIEPDDIIKIASGGELSRLMLAVKSLISINNLLPTIVFDEIDTGISGEVAGRVGNILRDIASNMQVITITHLPQIAALSDEHFKVFKVTDNDKTWSVINKLNREEQIDELAMMISGSTRLQGARDAALELMGIKQ